MQSTVISYSAMLLMDCNVILVTAHCKVNALEHIQMITDTLDATHVTK